MKTLREHQQIIVDDNRKKTGIWYGCGGGKTLTALHMACGRTLVICPKIVRDEKVWEKEADHVVHVDEMVVVSKEDFKRDVQTLITQQWDTLIVDEFDRCGGVTPNTRWRNKKEIPKTSQIFEALQLFVNTVKPSRLYLLTATITRSPFVVWGAGVILGKKWDWYKWREAFYVKLPMGPRIVAYAPKRDKATNERLANAIKTLGYIGTLEDWVDVPDHVYKTHRVPLSNEQNERIRGLKHIYYTPAIREKTHQIENGVLVGNRFITSERFKTKKMDIILDYVLQFPKILIFALYSEQIQSIKDMLEKEGIKVYVLDGKTKNKGGITAEAEASDRAVVIAQAQISAGYELPSFRCTIFVSTSKSFVDMVQAKGRTLRMNNIKMNCYVNIISGDVDKLAFKCVKSGVDFHYGVFNEG